MKTTRLVIAAVALIVLIGGAAFALSRKSSTGDNGTSTATNNTTTTTPSNATETESATPAPADAAATITWDGNNFSPEKVTVKSGDKVTIKNTGMETLEFDSDPHPVHTDDRELNVGSVEPGQSKTFTLTTKGTWGYHNHLNESQTGTIVVE